MKFYNNIFGATYKYYSRYQTEAPLFSAVCVVTVCQMALLFLGIILLKVSGLVDIFSMLPSKYYFIPIFILWLILVYRYYTKGKAAEIVENFEQKPLYQRRIWGVITVICFILPVVTIALLLKK
jgi:hypothetical protein